MSRRGTLYAAPALLLTTIAVFAPPSMAFYAKGSSDTCCINTGSFCICDGLFPGTVYRCLCGSGGTKCVCSFGGFAPTASLGPGGHVQIGGHAVCAEGAVADLRVTITQRGTGAVAEGRTRIACTGDETSWEIQGATVGRGAFSTTGPATACGLLEITGANDLRDAVQWCRDEIELLEP